MSPFRRCTAPMAKTAAFKGCFELADIPYVGCATLGLRA